MLNQEEFDRESIKVWMEMSESVTDAVKEHLPEYGGIYTRPSRVPKVTLPRSNRWSECAD